MLFDVLSLQTSLEPAIEVLVEVVMMCCEGRGGAGSGERVQRAAPWRGRCDQLSSNLSSVIHSLMLDRVSWGLASMDSTDKERSEAVPTTSVHDVYTNHLNQK